MPIPKVILKRGKKEAILRFHPWIFSGAIFKIEGKVEEGDTVEVYAADDTYLAMGHYQNGSIMIRVLSYKQEANDQAFWNTRLEDAVALRERLGLIKNASTNAFRLIHAEGDYLPGLVVDIYNQTAVVQCHSIGMHKDRLKIAHAICHALGDSIKFVYDKSKETLPFNYATSFENSYIIGEGNEGNATINENDHQFFIEWEKGQKTGFFLDQRDNRKLLAQYVKGKTVLNNFSYSGGFSVYALKAGASKVISVDASKKAIAWASKNVEINGFGEDKHEAIAADVMEYLKKNDTLYDLMIVDPPAFAKNVKKRHNAVQGYKRLNAAAFKKMNPGGIVFTFSCSQVVNRDLFYNTMVAAALEAGKKIRVLHHLSQPADHPVNIFHPEGSYLKGLVLRVD